MHQPTRFAPALALALIPWLAGACAGGPTAPRAAGSEIFDANGRSVIEGQVTEVTSAAAASATATTSSDRSGIRVSVQGTDRHARTDRRGRFRLNRVPAGNLVLRFERSDIDADLGLDGVGSGELVNLKVKVQGSDATVVARQDEELAEFEGPVLDVEGSGTSGSLQVDDVRSGSVLEVEVDDDTAWDPAGDATDLDEIRAALDRGDDVRAEGEGSPRDDGGLLAVEIAVEIDEAEEEEREAAGVVSAVDRSNRTFTVAPEADDDGSGSTVVAVDESTSWTDDIGSFEELADLFDLGAVIDAEAEGTALEDDPTADMLAARVDAEGREAKVQGEVTAVDRTSDTFTVDPGSSGEGSDGDSPAVVQVDDSTSWSGEIDSFEELADHFDAGDAIEAEAEGLTLRDGLSADILARDVDAEAEVDEDDGDDEGDDGDDADFSDEIADIEELIEDTREVANEHGLNSGQLNSLVVKLENAIASLERGNDEAAVGQLNAYINQVEAFVRGGQLPDEDDVRELIEDAEEIIEAIRDK